MAKIIIGFAGQLASGKDVCKKYLMDKHGAGSTRFSNVLRDILNRLYLPITRENMQDLSLDLRNRFGGDILSRVVIEDIKKSPQDIMVIDGVRRLEDLDSLKEFSRLYLISLEVNTRVRYDRAVLRNENVGDADKTYEQFLIDGEREAEREIPTVMAAAQYHIDNNGTFEDLYAQLEKIMAEIKK
jgi:dephospho-CoA kinase